MLLVEEEIYMSTLDNFDKKLYQKFIYGIQYIFIYFLVLLLLFLLVIPVLNISPFVMMIIITVGVITVYFYNSEFLCLILIALWTSYVFSYNLFYNLYSGGQLISESYIGLSVILLIYLFIIYMQISNDISIRKPRKMLYDERKLDLNRIESIIKEESINILGIESGWGTGKTLLIDHFIYNHQKDYIFIRIDTIALNLDDVIEYLVQQIAEQLDNQYIFNKTNRRLVSYIKSFKYGSLVTDLLATETTYSAELNKLKDSLNGLDRSIIIIFEDLDRIDDKEILRKLFYISERLTSEIQGKLKVVYQYTPKELNDKGFDNYYLQKYIPKTIQLTHIQFMKIFDYIIAYDYERYKCVLEYRQIIENIVNSITNWYGYSRTVIDPLEKERYLDSVYNTRNIESFIRSLSFYIKEYSETITENFGFSKVLIQTCYIKYFLPKYYQTVSTKFDIIYNFRINYEDDIYYIWNLLSVTMDQSIPIGLARAFSDDKMRDLFSPKSNPVNFEMFLAYCVLELYMYNLSGLDEPRSTNISIIESNYNSSAFELNKNVRIKLKRLEHYFYTCIAAGNEAQSTHIIFANEFADKILSNDNIELTIFDEFMEHSFKKFAFEDTCFVGIDTWAAIFKSFYYASINWKEDVINSYYNRLILLFFRYYKNEFDDKIDLYLFRNLNIFLSGVQNYCLKNSFISMVRHINCLKCNNGFSSNIYFIVFQENIIKSLIDLEYISDNYRKDLSEFIHKSEVEILTTISAILVSIKDEFSIMIDEISSHRAYECSSYVDEMVSIITFIDKLLLLNKVQSQNFNDNEYMESESFEEKILSDKELRSCIENHSIGTYHLYNELKRRSISNTNQA